MVLDRLLATAPRARLATLPTPLHPLARLARALGGPELWVKRDDLTGLAGGGNKTRKLEFVVGDALRVGADLLVTVGAIQSNHTRQTAAAAARSGLGCVLLHNAWAPDAGRYYRSTGNILLSEMLGARLYHDPTPRPGDDAGRLDDLARHLRQHGHRPYLIPTGASDHPLGGFGYAACAAEITAQGRQLGVTFDRVVHCTSSGSTQAGLLAGFAALGVDTPVTGISDDAERDVKRELVLRLANATLDALGLPQRVADSQVEIVVADHSPYGVASQATLEAIRLLARTEGLIADPVYEGRTIRGLMDLIAGGALRPGERVLVLHLGGTPAVHGYADQLSQDGLVPLPFATTATHR
jgi:1-aminocyclopropane-1-carboxylate deaminase